MKKDWEKYLDSLSEKEVRTIAHHLLEEQIEIMGSDGDVAYRPFEKSEYSDEPNIKECFYSTQSGEDLLKIRN